MNETIQNPKSVTLSCGWFGAAMTIAIIAARAFQPNAQPMCDWSVMSWFLMLLPTYWPMLLLVVFYILKFFVILFDGHKRSI